MSAIVVSWIGIALTLTGSTVHRYQYGYDAAGNREYARVTQATVSSTTHDNDRSYDYQYDALRRLIAADRGALNSGNTAIETTPTPTQSDWALDILGNWTGDTNVAGYTEQFDTAITETTHAVNLGNELTQVTVDSGSPVTVGYVCDRNGNLIYDGSFWLQYDAFNRLCQVHPAGGLDPNSFNPSGSLKDPNAAPDWIARYVHDAFGRLMRKRAPHPGDPDKRVTDEYYYDGVRRIQTKTTWQAVSGWPSGAAWQEYVYGPDYVDEFVAFVDDPLGAGVGTYYTLQDANYNLMATLRANANDGGPGGGGGGLTAENVVVRQYQWSPYGAPVVAETLTDNLPSAVTEAQAAAAGRSGHQGLFFERYDAGPDEPGIAANAAGIYYNRARFYTPYLGRFLQRDMNGAGLPVPVAAVARGLAMLLDRGQFDPFQHYHDGHNLFLYLGGAATNQRDPLGLVYDPFEDVDDYLTGDYIGGRVSAAEAQLTFFNQSFNAAQMTAGLLFSLVPGSDAIKLGIALAQGDQVSWTDVGAAVASVGGAALLVKAYQGYKKYQRAQNATKIVGAAAKRLLKPGDVVCGFAKDGKVVGDAAHGLMDHESLAIAMGIRNADGALEAGYEAFTVVKDARGIVSVLPSGKFGNLGGSVPQHVKDIVLGTFD